MYSSGHPRMCFCSSEQIWRNVKLQCIQKVFTVLHFFYILLCYSLIAKWIKLIIFLNSTNNTPYWQREKFVWNLCKFNKNKNEKSHVHKYSQPLPRYVVEAPLAPITASNLFGYDATSFDHHHLALSAILLLTSSPLKLGHVGQGQMHIFRFLQKYLTGFNPRLWLGHSRGVYKPLLLCV